jgi:branched-chain amino acid transport system permease protein
MRIPNLMHGSFFMLGAYFGVTFLAKGMNFWLAALLSAAAMAAIGALVERFLLRRLAGQELAQVLLTLGLSFVVADLCLMVWTGDPWQPATPSGFVGALQVSGLFFPIFRLVVVLVAVAIAIALWLLVDWTRLGAMIRAGVDDAPIARVVGIKVSQLFTLIFALGAGLAAFGGVMGAPILSVYPGLDGEMLPVALIVVILGGTGSLLGALVGSFVIGFLYNFGQAWFPDLAYVILFLPMVLVLVVRPQGLFGKVVP